MIHGSDKQVAWATDIIDAAKTALNGELLVVGLRAWAAPGQKLLADMSAEGFNALDALADEFQEYEAQGEHAYCQRVEESYLGVAIEALDACDSAREVIMCRDDHAAGIWAPAICRAAFAKASELQRRRVPKQREEPHLAR